MEWLRYITFRLYCSFLAFWSPPALVEDSDSDSDIEESAGNIIDPLQFPITPAPSPSSHDLGGFEFEEDEWEKVE